MCHQLYLDVLDGHNRAGEVRVRVDLDDHSVHPVWEDVLEILRGKRKKRMSVSEALSNSSTLGWLSFNDSRINCWTNTSHVTLVVHGPNRASRTYDERHIIESRPL